MNAFNASFAIAGRQIGDQAPVFIIAEAGVAHFGNLDKGVALVDLAADAGADAFKTQAFITDALISGRLPEWRDRLRPKEVPFEFIAAMKERADKRGLMFLCTAHDPIALDWVDRLDVPAYKIGSGERGNLPFLRVIGSRKKPVILSTGMYETHHIREAVDALGEGGCTDVGLLHCVTSYPTPADQVNLRAMDVLRSVFTGPVGYSDHTVGHAAVLAAVAHGASIVEKHITLDFNVPNAQDWKVSCGPADLADFVRSIRAVETMLGRAEKAIQACEKDALNWALKSLVACRDLPAGHVLREDDMTARRPGDGLAPSAMPQLLGRSLVRAIAADAVITLQDVQR